jgi:hypothetical protein
MLKGEANPLIGRRSVCKHNQALPWKENEASLPTFTVGGTPGALQALDSSKKTR